jgi:hypothetical protein
MKIQNRPSQPVRGQSPMYQGPGSSQPSGPQDVYQSAEFQQDMRSASIWGVSVGTVVATGLALALRPNLGVTLAMGLSGALVGGCIAEEQVKMRWGIPIEMPPAYR